MSLNIVIEDGERVLSRAWLEPWTQVRQVKSIVQKQTGMHPDFQRLFYRGQELLSENVLDDYGIVTHSCLTLIVSNRPASEECISVYGTLPCPQAMLQMIEAAKSGLKLGIAPQLAAEGLGGTYFLKNPEEERIAVFKPYDEEAFSPNNPKQNTGELGLEGVRPGVRSGEGHVREVAAYLLDHGGFADVPMTVRAEISRGVFKQSSGSDMHGPGLTSRLEEVLKSRPEPASGNSKALQQNPTKIGSLQEFVKYDDVISDISNSLLSKREVHKIAILDMRLLNTDRNDANLLVRYECGSPRANPSGGRGFSDASPIPMSSSSGGSSVARSTRISPRHSSGTSSHPRMIGPGTPMRVFDGISPLRTASPISAFVEEEDPEALSPTETGFSPLGGAPNSPPSLLQTPSRPLAIPARSTSTASGSRFGKSGESQRTSSGHASSRQPGQPFNDFGRHQVGSTRRYDVLANQKQSEDQPQPSFLQHDDNVLDLMDPDEDVGFFFSAMESTPSSPRDQPLLNTDLMHRSHEGTPEPQGGSGGGFVDDFDPPALMVGRAISGGGRHRIPRTSSRASATSSISSTRSSAAHHPWLPPGIRSRMSSENADGTGSSGRLSPDSSPQLTPSMRGLRRLASDGSRHRPMAYGPSHPLLIQGSRPGPQNRPATPGLSEDDPDMDFLGRSAPVHALSSPLLIGRGSGGFHSPHSRHQPQSGFGLPQTEIEEQFEAELASREVSQPSNCARHRGGKCSHRVVKLIPIDHSNSLPDTMGISWADWAWIGWRQAKEPLDEDMRAYIENLDIERDVELLRTTVSIREPCLRLMRISNILLKKGVRAGLSLYDIAQLICREDMDKPSQLEIACWHALALARANNKRMSLTVGGNTVVANLPVMDGESSHGGVFRRRRSHSMGSLMDMKISQDGFGLSETISPTHTQHNNSEEDEKKKNGVGGGRSAEAPKVYWRGRSRQFEKEVAEIEGQMFFHSLDTTLDHLLDLVKALKSRKQGKIYTPLATFTPSQSPIPSTPVSVGSLQLNKPHHHHHHHHQQSRSSSRAAQDAYTASGSYSMTPIFNGGAGPLGSVRRGSGGGGGFSSSLSRSAHAHHHHHHHFHHDDASHPLDFSLDEEDSDIPVGSAPVPVLVPHLLSQRNFGNNRRKVSDEGMSSSVFGELSSGSRGVRGSRSRASSVVIPLGARPISSKVSRAPHAGGGVFSSPSHYISSNRNSRSPSFASSETHSGVAEADQPAGSSNRRDNFSHRSRNLPSQVHNHHHRRHNHHHQMAAAGGLAPAHHQSNFLRSGGLGVPVTPAIGSSTMQSPV